MVDSLIFDIDGTLWDSTYIVSDAWNKVLNQKPEIALVITPELLKNKATELRNLRSAHDENMARMRSIITGMDSFFTGKAQQSMVNEYDSMQPTFARFSEMIENYAIFLDKTANEFEDQAAVSSAALRKNIVE